MDQYDTEVNNNFIKQYDIEAALINKQKDRNCKWLQTFTIIIISIILVVIASYLLTKIEYLF